MMRSIFVLVCGVLLAVSCGGPGDTPSHVEPDGQSVADVEPEGEETEEVELPPVDAKPLSEIVRMLEDVGYAPMIEIEFEDGVWEVEALHYGRIVEIAIDPVTGEVVEDHARALNGSADRTARRT